MTAQGEITRVFAREVLDSRGKPTVEVEITCGDGSCGRAIVPSGASTGQYEACELRDSDANWYDGTGVRQAVQNVNSVLGPAMLGIEAADQSEIDAVLLDLDGSPQKTLYGANALLGVSLAAAHAGAQCGKIPLWRHLHEMFRGVAGPLALEPRMPLPMTNMISGGLHAGGNLDFQDFLIAPHEPAPYAVRLERIVRVYRRLGELLAAAGFEGRLVGDEGGYGPRLSSNAQAVELVVAAIEQAGLKPGEQVSLTLDVAATHFYEGSHYKLAATGDQALTSEQMIVELESLSARFPIRAIEDGLAEQDWSGWQQLTKRLGRLQLVGDDLFVTNVERIQRGIDEQAGNAVLIKLNQIGTLSETLAAIALARRAGFSIVVSARSGETEDTTIADLAVAVAADYIKIGSIVRSERLAKYNQLLRIAEEVEA